MIRKLKKILLSSLTIATLFTSVGLSQKEVKAEEQIKVIVNGEYVVFDQQPILENGSVFVPMRAIFEALDFEVKWDNQFQLVIAHLIEDYYLVDVKLYSGNKMSVGYVEYTRGDTYVTNHTTNREKKDMATDFNNSFTLNPPYKNIDGRILVPVRAISEGTGADVEWDGANKTVIIDSSNKVIINNETGVSYDVESAKNRVDSYFSNQNVDISGNGDNKSDNSTENGSNTTNQDLTREEKELEIVRLVNIERVNAGLNEVEVADDLMYVARWHADEMVELDYFSHMSPTYNLQHTQLAKALGADYRYAGENSHAGSYTPEYTMSEWLSSSAHKAHILNPNHKYIGVGYSEGDARYGSYWSLFMGY